MTTRQFALAIALCSLAGAALAEGLTITAEAEAKIRTTLTEQGYEVRKIQVEDGNYEAYALKDGKKYEIYMDDKFQVVDVKED